MNKVMFCVLLLGGYSGDVLPKGAQQQSGYAPGDQLPIIFEENFERDIEEGFFPQR